MRLGSIALVLALGLSAGTAHGELASRTEQQRIVRVAVLGDSLAEGLWASLYRRFLRNRAVRVVNLARSSTGFNATAYEETLAQGLAREPIDLLIVQAGANDRQRVVSLDRHQVAHFGTERWFALYGQRLTYFLATAQRRRIPVLWVGLPIMRDPPFDRGMRIIGSVQRERALLHGASYLDITRFTAGPEGNFVDYKTGANGKVRRFRHADGVHFWEFGYDLVAEHVATEIRARFPGILPPR